MKHIKKFDGLDEGLKYGGSLSKEEKELRDGLEAVGKKFWASRGAKYGKRQKVKDIDLPKDGPSIPSKFTEDTEFITEGIRFSGEMGKINCELWIKTFKKDGSEGNPIRLSWQSIDKDDFENYGWK